MKQPDIIQTILKDSNYHLTLFTEDEINKLRKNVFTKTVRNKETQFMITLKKVLLRSSGFGPWEPQKMYQKSLLRIDLK